jgi:DNA polymerase-1
VPSGGRGGENPLLAVDGDSFAHRAYHALPKSIRFNAVVGFANMLIRLWEMESPRAVLVGWDSLGTPTYRNELFPGYQGGREFDDSLLTQLDMLPQLVNALGFVAAKEGGYEADDFLAAAVRAEEARGGTCVVATGDRDAFQLASESTVILFPTRGVSEMTRVGPDEVRERYGVEPHQVPDFIALRGDPSDKLPGAKGVGPKTAADLLRQYGSLDDALAAGRFAAQADELRMYRHIAAMDADAPVPELADAHPDWQGGSALAREWGLNQLADRLAKRTETPSTS